MEKKFGTQFEVKFAEILRNPKMIIKTNKRSIQFFGLPGAGKTYFYQKMANGKNNLVQVVNGKYSCFSWFLTFHPISTFRMLYLISRENKHNRKLLDYKLKLFKRASSLQFKSIFIKNPIIDEGFCQFFITLFERKITTKDLLVIKKIIPKETKIIIIEASNEKRLSRIKKRARMPRSFMGKDYLAYIFPIWEHNFRMLEKYYVNNFDAEIIGN